MKIEKLAIFDLDGTILMGNSHLDILEAFYSIRRSSISFKLCWRLNPKGLLRYLNVKLESIPDNFIQNYEFKYNKDVLELLKKVDSQGYQIKIISNAPPKILKVMQSRLKIECLHAPIGEKSLALESYDYEHLLVCTDNITDMDILVLADQRFIVANSSDFKKFPENSYFIER